MLSHVYSIHTCIYILICTHIPFLDTYHISFIIFWVLSVPFVHENSRRFVASILFNELNIKNTRLKRGITLISVFFVLLVLLSFNFIKIFNITILGTFGLVVYPLCIFFIVLGILNLCNNRYSIIKIDPLGTSYQWSCLLWHKE